MCTHSYKQKLEQSAAEQTQMLEAMEIMRIRYEDGQKNVVAAEQALLEQHAAFEKLREESVASVSAFEATDAASKAEIKRLQVELEVIGTEIAQKSAEIEHLNESRNMHANNVDQLKTELDEQSVSLENLRSEQHGKDLEIAALQAEILSLNADIEHLNGTVSTQTEQLQQALNSNSDGGAALEDLQQRLSVAVAEAAAMLQKESEMQQQLFASEQARVESIAELTASHEAAITTMQLQMLQVQEELQAAQQQLQQSIDQQQVREDAEHSAAIARLDTQISELKEQLATHDRNAAREQSAIMLMADEQLSTMRAELAEQTALSEGSAATIARLEQQNNSLFITCEKLRMDAMEAAQTAAPMVATAKKQFEEELAAFKESAAVAQAQLEETRAELAALEGKYESRHAQMCASLEEKDKRIAKLDACKMTEEHIEKFKSYKAERAKFKEESKKSSEEIVRLQKNSKLLEEEKLKYREDAKSMKHQLAGLKKAYDELTAAHTEMNDRAAAMRIGVSSEGHKGIAPPSLEFVISDLKFQIAEMSGQLQQSKTITEALKGKLQECAKQLQVRICI
jgi:chromosome segregation ATPase